MDGTPGMVVAGAGECGVRAAFELREAGWTGPVTLVGAENALPYERPPLSKSVLAEPEGAREPPALCEDRALQDAGIEFLAGATVTGIDRDRHQAVLADGRRIPYQRLLLATGANARRLPLAGVDAGGVRYLRSRADAIVLRDRLRPGARIGVIGAGFIGLELAAAAAARGCAVTVIEAAPRPMSRAVPADLAATVADRHRQAGVDLRCGQGVERLVRRNGALLLELAGGETAEYDTVVAGVGAVPETALAEKAGLAVENGVRVDDRLTTSDPDIFAAGDCCSFPHPLYGGRRIRLEAWRNARDQGRAAARNMLGDDRPYAAVPWFWSDQFDLTLQIAGLTDAAARAVVRARPDGVRIRFGLEADGRLLSAAAVGPGNSVAKDIRLAELLIARRAAPDPAALGDPAIPLKTLLRQAPS
ncbi:FAD-dependent oxidoreductase [Streptomyces sp. S.PNR 29]|uniref:NAD(P)/FAD-dependent oxidoreductase n=1 Tax=Streptomyces sp. S.PNR 29 TaxID=2973805 RepID=UPI0025B0E25B|nr:FAD-dependent oxidoreductase [Streptomyces sp. S.PNR 29]MDN0200083.1 FAD-dependent oxidoreductase [Streptomyces sp. S.PNR 29]